MIADDDQYRLVVFPSLEFFDALHCGAIKRICAQAVERVGAESDDAAIGDDLSDPI